MNERIRELAEQNGFIHNWMPPGEQHDKLNNLEKFAELIVKECALVVHKKTGPKYALDVLEHFGVEECRQVSGHAGGLWHIY